MYFLSLKINLCNVSMCAQVYKVHQVLADVHRGQKRAPDALGLELRMVGSHHVGAGN